MPRTASTSGRRDPRAKDRAAAEASEYLTAREVAQLLRIKKETLYAYVSRGLILSVARDKRSGHLYRREDVERLRARGHARAEGSVFKSGAPRWSEPIVQTSVTQITADGPSYRGRLALALERDNCTFESVADLLWSGTLVEGAAGWTHSRAVASMDRLLRAAGVDPAAADMVKVFTAMVAALAGGQWGEDLRDGTTIPAARALLMEMPRCLGYLTKDRCYARVAGDGSLAATILASSKVAAPSAAAVNAVNSALVLLADHELTPQTFAARLAASNGANLHFCLLAALSVHSGSRIRRACDRIEDILLAASGPQDFHDRIGEISRSVHAIPGFNHPLYPKGDARATRLIDIARNLSAEAGGGAFAYGQLLEEMLSREKARPSVEAGLVILCQVLRLPYRSAGAILTIARCAGWVAHVIEQRLAGIMLRPRARYFS